MDEETRRVLRVWIRYSNDDKATKIQDEFFHLDAWLNIDKAGVNTNYLCKGLRNQNLYIRTYFLNSSHVNIKFPNVYSPR